MTKAWREKKAGMYGPGILDPEVFEVQEASAKAKVGMYGPGILGEEEYARITGNAPKAPEKPEEAPPAPGPTKDPQSPGHAQLDSLVAKYANDDGYLSIANVKKILEEMPNAFDRILGWELARVDGPRIGALNHLLQLEIKREGGPRAPVQQAIEKAIVKARGD